jgi:hypothetical protein
VKYPVLLTFGFVALVACGDSSGPAEEPAATGPFSEFFDDGGYLLSDSHAVVIRDIRFFGEDDDGALEGFDLDNTVSEAGNTQTCGHPDSTDAAGQTGIDNQLGVIWNYLIGPLVGEATHALINGAINEGRLLMAVELEGVDDLKNDDDVSLTFFRATGDPYVGTFGYLAPSQTYMVDQEFPSTTIHNLQIVDGVLTAGPVEFQVPVDVLDEFFIVTVSAGKVRLTIHEDGSATGLLGGIIDVLTLLEEGYQTNAADEFRLVTPLFLDNTDMMPNDESGCDGMSAAFQFSATTGFIVHYDQDPAGE